LGGGSLKKDKCAKKKDSPGRGESPGDVVPLPVKRGRRGGLIGVLGEVMQKPVVKKVLSPTGWSE